MPNRAKPTQEGELAEVVRRVWASAGLGAARTADIVFYDIEGMGHMWPLHEAIPPGSTYVAEYAEVDYLNEAMRFFTDHALP